MEEVPPLVSSVVAIIPEQFIELALNTLRGPTHIVIISSYNFFWLATCSSIINIQYHANLMVRPEQGSCARSISLTKQETALVAVIVHGVQRPWWQAGSSQRDSNVKIPSASALPHSSTSC